MSPILQMWELKLSRLSWPGSDSQLWITGLCRSKACPWMNLASPATLRGTNHTQGPTCSSSWHTHTTPALPLSPLHVTQCTLAHPASHTCLFPHTPSCGRTRPPGSILCYRVTHRGRAPAIPTLPRALRGLFPNLELFQSLVNSGTSVGPQGS